MEDKNKESSTDSGIKMNHQVQELEFQVLTVLNRLEEAVEKFDGRGTVSSLKVTQSLPISAKSYHEIINIIQDAIVNLDLSKDEEEPNLAILPVLRDVEKLSLLSHSIKQYIMCLDISHTEYLLYWIENETTNWIIHLFGTEECKIFYDENYLDGFLKLFRLLLLRKYPTYHEDGFEAFKQGEPVIYYNSLSMFSIAQYLCSNTGLSLRFIQEVPFTTKKNDEIEEFRKILEEDLNKQKVPVLFLMSAETQISSFQCNINNVRHFCKEHNIWLHVIGSSLAVLPVLHCKQPDLKCSQFFDSITIMFGSWLNVPSLPSVTLFKTISGEKYLNVEKDNKNGNSLPLWTVMQYLGHERIVNDFIQKFDTCLRLFNRLKKNSSLKILSEYNIENNDNISQNDLITKSLTNDDILGMVISSVIFKFLPENSTLWSPSYCDKLNSWLSQVLHRELPVVPIRAIDLKDYGTVLRYAPFQHTPVISESDWLSFFSCLDQQLDILKSTVSQKETLYKMIQNSTCLKLVELPDWAGLGGVQYFPEAWKRDDNNKVSKDELNRLNLQIVQQLRNTDSAFSVGESNDGFACIRFGMVGWDSDVVDLINLVETIGKQEEDSWNFIDTMAEVVKKGIETATLDLQKENEEKLWQEGILRHVPVFGNIMNWWSPVNKENGGGIKGRSLDLTAGVIESTENIYRYHIQRGSKMSGVQSYPQSVVQTSLTSIPGKVECDTSDITK